METVDTSGKALIEFWKWAAEKGEMNTNTAGAIQAACVQILKSTENWETLDVKILDIDDACRRFQNKRSKDFKPQSLSTYIQRFKSGVTMFLNYASNPSSWRPSQKVRTSNVKERKKDSEKVNQKIFLAKQSHEIEHKEMIGRSTLPSFASAPLIEYPFPLREGQLAYLRLPGDLKNTEVKRLSAYLNTLTIDSEGGSN